MSIDDHGHYLTSAASRAARPDAYDNGADGVVVIQGTDTIEETAFALDMMIQTECPVIVTGAMRNPSMAGSDGPANLVTAISAAMKVVLSGYGVIVAFDNELHLACHCAFRAHPPGDSDLIRPPVPI